MNAGRWIAAGIGLAAVGAAAVYAQYRQTEQPDFALVSADEDFELRDYPSLVVAEVSHSGSRERASGASFRRLAAYIFAQDRPAGGEKIAMTAPVLQDETQPGEWRMRFVMPSKYTLETLPSAPADIALTQVPARRMAAIRFSGNGGGRDLALMEARLRDWMMAQGLMPAGEAEFAFYDAPMVPGPLRRNEVLIPVATK
ncbi:DNA gyrase inhibitor GyrI [Erythromicrobium ramosum]|uniref:DNA gyrase inhibitor GyrI n=1 Tax=Erythrobacter ramosus TaxID=35811 RepID=A0A6I4UL73_9SPHN|nr:heme-binding protein [Erythrobacter ramosus]MBB3775533.1 DNA gyrase inhibitor GyrI [Erythrobacter ramosus]MXP39368.1 heme-binding protein [Erythrobacter ramosus]